MRVACVNADSQLRDGPWERDPSQTSGRGETFRDVLRHDCHRIALGDELRHGGESGYLNANLYATFTL